MKRPCAWNCYVLCQKNLMICWMKFLKMISYMVPNDFFFCKHLQLYLADKFRPYAKSWLPACSGCRVCATNNSGTSDGFCRTSKKTCYTLAPYKVLGVVPPGYRILGIATVYPLIRRSHK